MPLRAPMAPGHWVMEAEVRFVCKHVQQALALQLVISGFSYPSSLSRSCLH